MGCALGACALAALCALAAAGPRYSSRIVHTRAGAVRGVIAEAGPRLEPVEVFRGVPYAAAPARLAAPAPAPAWPGTRLADTHAPACPHRRPDLANRTAALSRMPLGVWRAELEAEAAAGAQSEDCLGLDMYVPGSGARGLDAPYPVLVWAGGADGSRPDGAVLAAHEHLLVVVVYYRIGLLGFLTSGGEDEVSLAGGAAALDVRAALRWVGAEVAAFGGDPRRVTLAGHGAAAALVNTVLMLPDIKGLVSRVLLLSGTALSPSLMAPEPALAREHAAKALLCGRDGADWLQRCVRERPLSALLAVEPPSGRFLARWAPGVPRRAAQPAAPASRALHASDAFLDCALAVVVATTESYRFFSEDHIRHGFEEEYRNRVLRTFVRNVFRFHRNEIFAAVRNEYTDWEKPIQHPINIRDATLEALSDGAGAAPALRLAQLHARRGAATYLAHLAHQTRDPDYPQRLGSVSGDTLTYFLGVPLGEGAGAAGRNYSRSDVAVAEACAALVGAFARGEGAGRARRERPAAPAWPRYELSTQQYVSVAARVRVRSHYRGHKMSLWLHLVPQLHRAGAPPAHHRFRQPRPDMFAGELFPETYSTVSLDEAEDAEEEEDEEESEEGELEECGGPVSSPAPAAAASPGSPAPPQDLLALDSQYFRYRAALAVTVGAGCVLLALNVLVLAALYAQRRAAARRPARRAPAPPPAAPAPNRASPKKSSLKRSGELELKERAGAGPGAGAGKGATHKKRVHINEISV